MVTRSRQVTTHMICSHNPNTWPTNFILTSSNHQYHHPRHHSNVMIISGSLICHTTTTSSHHHGTRRPSSKDLVLASSRMLWRPTRKTTPSSTPGSNLVVVAWEGFTLIVINENHWKEPQVKWWAGWLAGRSISPTLQDVNISFNHESLYYLISRGGGGSNYIRE